MINFRHKDHQEGKNGDPGGKSHHEIAHGLNPYSLVPCDGVVVACEQMGGTSIKTGKEEKRR